VFNFEAKLNFLIDKSVNTMEGKMSWYRLEYRTSNGLKKDYIGKQIK